MMDSREDSEEDIPHASNLGWWSVSHLVIYMFHCYSLRSSQPRLLPQSPKVCSIHLCLFIQSEVSQKDKHQYSILTHIYGILKDGSNNPICRLEPFYFAWWKQRCKVSCKVDFLFKFRNFTSCAVAMDWIVFPENVHVKTLINMMLLEDGSFGK